MNVSKKYDVAVIGYGPGGEIATATLGARGHHVIALERFPSPYPLPRAVTFDGEACRSVQATGADVDRALRRSTVLDSAVFADANGVEVFRHDWSGALCGFASRRSIFQPDVEAALDERIATFPNVTVSRGTTVTAVEQDADEVRLQVVAEDGVSSTIRARYVVGADGTNSFLRTALGVPVDRSGFKNALLNFDMEVLRPLPERFGGFRSFMDPERTHMFMPIGTERVRFEFHVLPGDDEEALLDEAVVWSWLETKHGLTREDVRLNRQIIYRFASSVAQQWRVGRAFLVGDAAHSMTPAMGQGANSSIRDARNLSWKLAMVLEGAAGEHLLDTYEAELKPFTTRIVMEAERISRLASVRDAEAANARNQSLREGKTEASTPFKWSVVAGLSASSGPSKTGGVVGQLAPQGRLRRSGDAKRGDDLLGAGFQLICKGHLSLSDFQWSFLEKIGCGCAVLDAASGEPQAAEDVDGTYRDYLERHGIDFYLMRPDFYVFAAGSLGDVSLAIEALETALKAPEQLPGMIHLGRAHT